ncbi:MAG: GNAT family N-acetyltransferase [Spirosomaceae bacterium]|jgi:putative acetyltransferase|nr:GNAT family N-acetyltransferase [Spirosomataceae bacterium]
MLFREVKFHDLKEIQQLFVETISEVCKNDYNPRQIEVWTSSIENHERWTNILSNQYVLIAQIDEKIVGFCTLENHTYIDLFYVHKDFQGQGIAHKLYLQIEQKARQNGSKVLTSDVSITAKPFFERMGFKIVKEQTVVRKNTEFRNYKMSKEI